MENSFTAELFAIYLSNFSAHAIEYKGHMYPTVEHAYHCMKYTDARIREEILEQRSPEKAWEVAQKYKSMQLRDFKNRKLEIMEKLLRAKLEQHPDVKKVLIDSGDLEIIKHITTGPPPDGFWDDGDEGKGLNHIGGIWMNLRDEIRK